MLHALAMMVIAAAPAPAAPSGAEENEELVLKPQRGKVTLGNNLAELQVPETFGYLDPDQTEKVLVMWGNPPSKQKSLGMLIPSDVPIDDPNSWAVIISYDDDGHVADEDASDINYDDLLKEMQEGVAASNDERKAEGYASIQLVGWAAPPRYDSVNKKLHWAKRLKFEDAEEDTLNYNIRVLGKEGVLVLNAVSSINSLSAIEKTIPDILAFTKFSPGNTYADFDPKTGKLAAYGIAGLVAGKVAMKAGLLAGLLKFALAAKKLIILAAVGGAAAISKLFKKKTDA